MAGEEAARRVRDVGAAQAAALERVEPRAPSGDLAVLHRELGLVVARAHEVRAAAATAARDEQPGRAEVGALHRIEADAPLARGERARERERVDAATAPAPHARSRSARKTAAAPPAPSAARARRARGGRAPRRPVGAGARAVVNTSAS